MPSGRPVRLSALGVAAISTIALMAAPSTALGKAHKPTIRLGAKLPALGSAAFTRAIFKVKPAPKAPKGGRKAPKPKVKARIRNRSAVPKNAHLYLHLRRKKKKPNTFVADLLLINSKTGSARASGPAGETDELQPGDVVEVELDLILADGTVVKGTAIGKVVEDGDIDEPDPNPPLKVCRGVDHASFEESINRALFGFSLSGISANELDDLVEAAEELFCGEAVPGDPVVERLLHAAGWYRPTGGGSYCIGALMPAPPPFAGEEFEVNVSCTAPATSLGFVLPENRSVNAFIAPPQLPQCQNLPIGAMGHWLYCSGGTLPANTPTTVRIHPSSQLGSCNTIGVFLNPPSSGPSGSSYNTNTFGSCP